MASYAKWNQGIAEHFFLNPIRHGQEVLFSVTEAAIEEIAKGLDIEHSDGAVADFLTALFNPPGEWLLPNETLSQTPSDIFVRAQRMLDAFLKLYIDGDNLPADYPDAPAFLAYLAFPVLALNLVDPDDDEHIGFNAAYALMCKALTDYGLVDWVAETRARDRETQLTGEEYRNFVKKSVEWQGETTFVWGYLVRWTEVTNDFDGCAILDSPEIAIISSGHWSNAAGSYLVPVRYAAVLRKEDEEIIQDCILPLLKHDRETPSDDEVAAALLKFKAHFSHRFKDAIDKKLSTLCRMVITRWRGWDGVSSGDKEQPAPPTKPYVIEPVMWARGNELFRVGARLSSPSGSFPEQVTITLPGGQSVEASRMLQRKSAPLMDQTPVSRLLSLPGSIVTDESGETAHTVLSEKTRFVWEAAINAWVPGQPKVGQRHILLHPADDYDPANEASRKLRDAFGRPFEYSFKIAHSGDPGLAVADESSVVYGSLVGGLLSPSGGYLMQSPPTIRLRNGNPDEVEVKTHRQETLEFDSSVWGWKIPKQDVPETIIVECVSKSGGQRKYTVEFVDWPDLWRDSEIMEASDWSDMRLSALSDIGPDLLNLDTSIPDIYGRHKEDQHERDTLAKQRRISNSLLEGQDLRGIHFHRFEQIAGLPVAGPELPMDAPTDIGYKPRRPMALGPAEPEDDDAPDDPPPPSKPRRRKDKQPSTEETIVISVPGGGPSNAPTSRPCVSCGRPGVERGATSMPCPNCGVPLVRCANCRKRARTWFCLELKCKTWGP